MFFRTKGQKLTKCSNLCFQTWALLSNTGLSPSAFEPCRLTLYFWGETHNVSSALFIGVWPNCHRCSSQCLWAPNWAHCYCVVWALRQTPHAVFLLSATIIIIKSVSLPLSRPRRTYTTPKHEVSPYKSRLFFQTGDVNVPRIARIHWMFFLIFCPQRKEHFSISFRFLRCRCPPGKTTYKHFRHFFSSARFFAQKKEGGVGTLLLGSYVY